MIRDAITAELTVNTNNLTVLILAAGYGRRMGPFSRMINKSLVPYGDKPLISHIIDKFPKETTKFVIACGHMGQQVKDYVSTVHNDKCVVFVDIPDYSEGQTGPATTIQHCGPHIRNGFMWISCDTLFEFDYADKLDHNWIGVYPVDSHLAKDYCWITRNGEEIVTTYNKVPSDTAVDAFIGLMYCKDDQYLNQLINTQATETPQGFVNLTLKAHTVLNWLDFGTYEKWQAINRTTTENSFVKPDEIFYHDNGKVIKYFSKEDHAISRIRRAQANPDCMPANMKNVGNFLIHDWADGDILYNQITPELFRKMLNWCDKNMWVDPHSDENTQPLCEKFYRDKTLERLNQFRIKYTDWSECCVVNRREVDSIDNYLNRIDWNWLCGKREWAWIHGDLHFDNTVYNSKTDKFTAIDWRTDFVGSIYGDVYYDLAKMLGGIWLNYRAIKDHKYDYIDSNDYATIEIPSIENAQVYEDILQGFVNKKGLDWGKVKLLVPLIYLNMSPLHEAPFDKFLIALAQLHFSQIL
jgi:GTP:adenosylcobinamide-phosphate guanylyltransferase